MSVSIYLSNQFIQVATGTRAKKGTLKAVYTTLAPEGSIINGIIMDGESLGNHLKRFWEENKLPKNDVFLVLNSNKIAGKNVEIPNMNPKKTKQFILREFADMQRDSEENTIAFIPVGTSAGAKLRHLYAESAPKEQLKEFLELFQSIGIKLKGIISGEGSIIGYAKTHIAKSYKTFVMQISNGNIVFNLLFVDGMFKYFNSVRCFNEIGTEGYFDDMARSLNQLGQFMQTQRITSPIERVFLCGVQREDMMTYGQIIREMGTEAGCEMLDTGFGAGTGLQFASNQAIFALSGLYDCGLDSNFLTHFSLKSEKESALDPRIKKYGLVVLVALGIMAIALGTSFALRMVRQNKLDELNDYNESVAATAMFYDMEAERRDNLAAKYNSINSVVETIESYPVCNDKIVGVLQNTAAGYADIEISSFDADSGKVSFTAKSANVNDIYKYIDRLFEEAIFSNVEHTGYTYESGSDNYLIHVDCTLSESAGRELSVKTE
ncbi:MAG: hypothetical protein K5879_03740 [Lachnospiraceae bacterium]|nr:hypothetical protein [Lachnospiraceae bacterium]